LAKQQCLTKNGSAGPTTVAATCSVPFHELGRGVKHWVATLVPDERRVILDVEVTYLYQELKCKRQ